MLEFSTWISSYYLCSLGDVLKTAMPHGTMVKSRIRIHLSEKVLHDIKEVPDNFLKKKLRSTFRSTAADSEVSLNDRQKEVLDTVIQHGSILLKKLERSFKENVLSAVRSLEVICLTISASASDYKTPAFRQI